LNETAGNHDSSESSSELTQSSSAEDLSNSSSQIVPPTHESNNSFANETSRGDTSLEQASPNNELNNSEAVNGSTLVPAVVPLGNNSAVPQGHDLNDTEAGSLNDTSRVSTIPLDNEFNNSDTASGLNTSRFSTIDNEFNNSETEFNNSDAEFNNSQPVSEVNNTRIHNEFNNSEFNNSEAASQTSRNSEFNNSEALSNVNATSGFSSNEFNNSNEFNSSGSQESDFLQESNFTQNETAGGDDLHIVTLNETQPSPSGGSGEFVSSSEEGLNGASQEGLGNSANESAVGGNATLPKKQQLCFDVPAAPRNRTAVVCSSKASTPLALPRAWLLMNNLNPDAGDACKSWTPAVGSKSVGCVNV